MPARRRKKLEQKPVPTFETEAEEREFWETHDTTAYVDWRRGRLATRAQWSRTSPSRGGGGA